MARVEVATQAWGYVTDAKGRPLPAQVPTINTTVYAAATGGTTIAAADFKSQADGVLPGFVEEGTYTFTEPDGQVRTVEAASASAAARAALGAQGYINHGAVAATARPVGYAGVEWVGSVQPTNMIDGDTWIDTTKIVSINDRDHKQAGMYALGAIPGSITTKTAVANQAELVRFVPSRAMTIISIAFNIETAASLNDAVDVGIYDAGGTRLGSSGAVTGHLNTATMRNVPLTAAVPLEADTIYYAAWAMGALTGTAPVYTAISRGSSNAMTMFGAAFPQLEGALKAASHPLPTSIVSPTARYNQPLMALRET